MSKVKFVAIIKDENGYSRISTNDADEFLRVVDRWIKMVKEAGK